MRMILAVMYREYRIRMTSMNWMFYDLIMPLVYLLVFGIGFNSAFAGGVVVEGIRVSYNAFFLAGVLSMAGFGIAINTSYGFFVDRENGIFYELLTYPMTRGEFLVGKILFNCLLSLIQAAGTIAAGSLLLDLTIRWELLGVAAIAQVLATAGWFFFLVTFAIRIRRNDMFNTFLNLVYFVLMFSSSMFYPAGTLPGWLQALSFGNPLTWHTDVLRYATIGAGNPEWILAEAGAFVVFLGLSFGAAVQTIRNPLRA
jgi:ABC-type polysaccharide/polyol phosphate export permease